MLMNPSSLLYIERNNLSTPSDRWPFSITTMRPSFQFPPIRDTPVRPSHRSSFQGAVRVPWKRIGSVRGVKSRKGRTEIGPCAALSNCSVCHFRVPIKISLSRIVGLCQWAGLLHLELTMVRKWSEFSNYWVYQTRLLMCQTGLFCM